MSREGNSKKVTKIFLQPVNERLRELKVMEIRKSKYCDYEATKCRRGGEMFLSNALNQKKILQFFYHESRKYSSCKQNGMWKIQKRSIVKL